MIKKLLRGIYYSLCLPIYLFKERTMNFSSYSYTRYAVSKLKKKDGCTITIGENFLIRPGGVINVDDGTNLIIGKNVHLSSNCMLRVTNKGTLVIGDNVFFARCAVISCWHKIIIHDEVIFAPYVALHDHQHKFDLSSPVDHAACDHFKPIEIGKGVWLGMRVHVLNGVRIGDFSVIGASSVVTKDIPSGCIAAGVPAKVVKKEMNIKRKEPQ